MRKPSGSARTQPKVILPRNSEPSLTPRHRRRRTVAAEDAFNIRINSSTGMRISKWVKSRRSACSSDSRYSPKEAPGRLPARGELLSGAG
eukprot:scaffold6785_cov108-Cylindrotheca_fusiformis.AAC.2